ncbi:MAG TPA: right-handed parallel beta-helix repeat-containing protein, partial [Acidimicrobiia bacterium]|nr:right-handed parallel beta-helix repeat-containing protein [Acidimicrobiia bacterium]
VDSVPDGSTIRFPPHACYRLDGTLRLDDRHRLLIDGRHAILRAFTRGSGGRLQVRERSQLSIANSSDIVVHELIVRGANPDGGTDPGAYQPAYEAQHGFSLLGDDGVVLWRVEAYDTYGDFVYIGGARTASRNITVDSSRFERSGRQGISITDATAVRITNTSIMGVARSLFDLEPNLRADEVRDVQITGNTTGSITNFWLADKGSGINVGDITVADNHVRGPSGGGIFVFGPAWGLRGPFTVRHNDFWTTLKVTDENLSAAIVFAHARGITIADNHVRVDATSTVVGVYLLGSKHASITGNGFDGVDQPVAQDAASSDVTSDEAVSTG